MSPSKIISDIENLMLDDGGGNYIQMYEGLGIIGEVTSKILGILIIAQLIGIPVVVSIEVLYINVPLLQNKVTKLMNNNKKANKILGLFLRDARHAIEIANTSETGKSVNAVYLELKIKIVFLVFLTICIVLGPGTMIIRWLARILNNILIG